MKLTKLLILLLLLSLKGYSQQAVLTSSGEKVILNFLSSMGGTITGTLGITGNTTISGTTTLTGINNTGTITNTGTLINTGNLTVNGNGTITGTLTLPSLTASTLLGTDGSSQIGTVSLTGDITTDGLIATLSNTGVISGTYGSLTAVPQITVDSKGRITTITTTTNTHTIGESYGGGIVFYVYDNGNHGLIAATSDQSTGIQWSITNTVTNAVRNGIHGGISNTERIIINQGAGSYAAQLCANYIGGDYADWYLPSEYELNLMYTNIGKGASSPNYNIGLFANDYYWSSSEYGDGTARGQWFNSGNPSFVSKYAESYVRAIRAF